MAIDATAADFPEHARSFSHWNPELAADPYPLFRHLRAECPVARSDELGGYYLLTRYDDVRDALRDHTTFTSKVLTLPPLEETLLPVPPLDQDPPVQTRFRQLMRAFFTPARAAELEPLVRETAQRLAGQLTSDSEVCLSYAFRIPTVLVARILGVEAGDYELFARWIEQSIDQAGIDADASLAAHMETFQYLQALLARRHDDPQDDLLTFLTSAELDGEPLTEMQRLGMAYLLLVAGIDTTANTLSNAIWYLAQDAAARSRLLAEPSLLPSAVEEFLRIYAPVSLVRGTTADTVVSGCPISAGTPVYLSIPSANRDERQFPDADNVVLDRRNNAHIAFGAGAHRCLGAHYARMELGVGIMELLRAVPSFRLADPAAVEWKTGPIRGPRRLRIAVE
jgi:cytochrome P450